jgi:hypothetical protein
MGQGGRGCTAYISKTEIVDLTDITCKCGRGYMNEEGTFIPGSIVRSGQALTEENYKSHRKSCEQCESDASACSDRRDMLLPPTPRQPEPHEPEDYVQFFFPAAGISENVLKRFLYANGGQEASELPHKTFKVSAHKKIIDI